MMKRICCLLLVMTSCKSSEPPASAMPVVVLGQVIDRTGSMATPSWSDSIHLAVSTANAALKREGRAMRFELVEANSGNSPEQARADGLKLVKQRGAKAIITDSSQENLLDYIDPTQYTILPNTAGCYTAEEAVRTARLAREALETDWIKLEVIGDQTTLFPDNEQTLEAARILVREGFVVLPYFTDDLIMAKKLLDAGCEAVMPLAAPIGSGLGIQNPANLRIMREQLPDATVIVDAGVGTASDAAIAMELEAVKASLRKEGGNLRRDRHL